MHCGTTGLHSPFALSLQFSVFPQLTLMTAGKLHGHFAPATTTAKVNFATSRSTCTFMLQRERFTDGPPHIPVPRPSRDAVITDCTGDRGRGRGLTSTLLCLQCFSLLGLAMATPPARCPLGLSSRTRQRLADEPHCYTTCCARRSSALCHARSIGLYSPAWELLDGCKHAHFRFLQHCWSRGRA